MWTFEDPEWLRRRNHFCPELTNEEWDRLLEKDFRSAIDLSCRVTVRDMMLEEGVKRVPKHRYRKDPLVP